MWYFNWIVVALSMGSIIVRFNTLKMKKSINLNSRKFLLDILKEFQENGLCYAPNSIYHGTKIGGRLSISKEALLTIEVGRLTDFIEYLFEHSEHCDHISQKDAWLEFCEYEIKNKEKFI